MKFAASKSFQKDVKSIRDKKLLARLAEVVEEIACAEKLEDIPQAAAMAGHPATYRIRLGDYRLGCFLDGTTLVLARFLHRKEIYRSFP